MITLYQLFIFLYHAVTLFLRVDYLLASRAMYTYQEKVVVFILSHGHAGSTLLGNVLGAHPQAIHLGEIVNPIERGGEIRCFYCGEQPCPVWNDIAQPKFVLSCYNKFTNATRKQHLPNRLKNIFSKPAPPRQPRYQENFTPGYSKNYPKLMSS